MNWAESRATDADSPKRPVGRIVTFYSYKGGTGRSMTLANVAWILSMQGCRVLVIDWDFEAPGLHRYYLPFLPDSEMTETSGLIDFFVHFIEAASLQANLPTKTTPEDPPWFFDYADLMRYSTPLDYEFPEGGVLDFVGAGQQGPTYGVRVNTFHWGEFYEKLGGGIFLEAVKSRLREEYDFVLIDSRTGLSDTSGICTVQMPDDLFVCFTLNRQSIFGAAATATSADLQRRRVDGTQGVRIWPVPMRVELAEKDRLEATRLVAREKFAPFLWHIPASQRPEYWGEMEVLYFPYYAYEEVLATIADPPYNKVSLLNSMTRIAARLIKGAVVVPSPPPEVRAQLLARYHSSTPAVPLTKPSRGPRFYISHALADGVEDLVRTLSKLIYARFGEQSVFWDDQVPLGAPWEATLRDEFARSDALIIAAGPHWGETVWTQQELRWGLELRKPIIPLLLHNTTWNSLPDAIRGRRGYKLDESKGEQALVHFVSQLPVTFATESPAEILGAANIDDPQKGQWGGQSEFGGRRLIAKVSNRENGWFLIGLAVERFDGLPLTGQIEFHLHPSFYPSIVNVPVRNDHAVLDLPAWGAFTVGASADRGSTRLELDLAELPNAPDLFRKR